MPQLTRFLDASAELLLEVLPFFALGALLAGVLEAYEDRLRLRERLGDSVGAIVLGAVMGAVVPVCSCGAVPIALGLLAGGVAPGPVLAFLAAAPMVNPASFVMTAGVLGYPLALGRLAGALAIGVAVGLLGKWLGRSALRAPLEGPALSGPFVGTEMDRTEPVPPPGPVGGTASVPSVVPVSKDGRDRARPSTGARWSLALLSGGRTFSGLFRFVLVGVALGAVLEVFLDPCSVTGYFQGPLAVPVAALVGVPFYVCSCAEVPVALSLLRKGLEEGAILTFLLAGPGVSVFTLVLLWGALRARAIVAYAGTFLAGSVALGYLWGAIFG